MNWVGIDGYYSTPAMTFGSLFGPTIAAVRERTGDPILIAETGSPPRPYGPADFKIADLFAGIRLYGLLGAIWFQAQKSATTGPAAITAFRRNAGLYRSSSS